MESVRHYFRDDLIVVFVGLVLLFAGVFGAANWNDHLHPHVPVVTPGSSQTQVDANFEKYQRQTESVGKDAVIPWVWAVPMTLIGLLGGTICLLVVAHRNS